MPSTTTLLHRVGLLLLAIFVLFTPVTVEASAEPRLCALERQTCTCDGVTYFGKRFKRARAGAVLGFNAMLQYRFVAVEQPSRVFECTVPNFPEDPMPKHVKQCWCLNEGTRPPTPPTNFEYFQIPGAIGNYTTCQVKKDAVRRNVQSVETCEKECNQDGQCDSFNYDSTFKVCYLLIDIGKDGCSMVKSTVDSVLFFTKKTRSYELFPGIKGNFELCQAGGVVTVTSSLQCLTECDQTDKCYSVAYDKTTRRCELLRSPMDKLCRVEENKNSNVDYYVNLKDISTFAPTGQPVATVSPTPKRIVPTVRPTTPPPTFRPTRGANIQRSLFTSTNTGTDSSNCGSVDVPCKTLAHSVQRLVTVAAAGEVNLEILLADGVYAGDGNVNVQIEDDWDKNIDIRGIGNVEMVGGGAPFFLQASNGRNIFLENLVISGFRQAVQVSKPNTHLEFISATVTNCSGVSGAVASVFEEATLVVRDSTFSFNRALERGGAISASEKATLRVMYSQLINNVAGGAGGALAATGESIVVITQSTLQGNEALFGGAIYISAGANLDISDGTKLSSNAATFSGAAIYSMESRVRITSSSLEDHVAGADGGAVYLRCVGAGAESVFSGVSMKRSITERNGGHMFVRSCPVQLTSGSVLETGSANAGGAVALVSADLSVEGSTLTENSAGGNGGAVHALSSRVSVQSSTISKNKAGRNGGGLHATMDASVTGDSASSFVENEAVGGGGGVFAAALDTEDVGTRKLVAFEISSTFERNQAAFGADKASSAALLCVGYQPSADGLCGSLNGSPAATSALNGVLKDTSTVFTCSDGKFVPVVEASTDSGLPNGLFLFEQDLFGNNYTAAGEGVIISLSSNSSLAESPSSIHGRTIIFTGTGASSCLDKTAVRGKPGSLARLQFAKDGRDITVLLDVRLQTCQFSTGKLMNSTDYSCKTCPDGTFADESGTCEACPSQGALCSEGQVFLDSGWWAPDVATTGETSLAALVRCPDAGTCSGKFSSSSRENGCVNGRTGLLCAACEEGLIPLGTSRECVECPDGAVLGVVVGIILLFNVTVIYGVSMRNRSFAVGVFKVLLTHLQILGLAVLVRTPWAEYLNYVFVYSSGLSMSSTSYMDCLLYNFRVADSTFIAESVLAVLIPIGFIIVLGLLVLLRQFVHLRTLRPTPDGLALFCSSLAVLYLAVHMLLARAGIEYFACFDAFEMIFGDTASVDNLRFLIADPSVLCNDESGNYASWAYGFGLVVLLLMGSVTPVIILLVVLRAFRHKAYGKLRMLCFTYEADVYFWDLVVFVRNLMVLCCVLLLQFETTGQVLSVLIVLAVSTLAQLYIQPFQDEEVNSMAMASLLVLILTFTSSLLLDGSSFTEQGSVVNGLVFAMNVCFFVYVCLSSACNRFQVLFDKLPFKRSEEAGQRQKEDAPRHPENDFAQQTTDYHGLTDGTTLSNHVGMRVRLVQLRERPELNGTEAVLVAYNESSGLCDVVSRNNQRFKVSRYNVELVGGNQQPAMEFGEDATGGGQQGQSALEHLDQEIAAAEKKIKDLEEENAKLKREAQYLGGLKQALVDNDDS